MRLAPLIALAIGLGASSSAAGANPVFLSVDGAAAKLEQGAVVLDARGHRAEAPYLPGAVTLDWMSLRDGWGRTGKLARESELRAALAGLGVEARRPVIVYGDVAGGWGEEGRIWWTLAYLGHPEVYILDGGIAAWVRAGKPTAAKPASPPRRAGRLQTETQSRLRADARQVNGAAARKDVVVIDTRTKEEYDGATPYFASRGGHVPKARHLYWSDLVDKDGKVKPAAELNGLFEARGITNDRRVITYCTGGVRSAFVVAVLRHAGVNDAANYDGSWWDWASQDDLPVE